MKRNLKLITTVKVEGFIYDRETKTRRPVSAYAELWVDDGAVIRQLYGRALNSKRKQSVLAGGAVKVKMTDIIPAAQPKET